jgi:hypothetical protein
MAAARDLFQLVQKIAPFDISAGSIRRASRGGDSTGQRIATGKRAASPKRHRIFIIEHDESICRMTVRKAKGTTTS